MVCSERLVGANGCRARVLKRAMFRPPLYAILASVAVPVDWSVPADFERAKRKASRERMPFLRIEWDD